jgi:hypothetical protein
MSVLQTYGVVAPVDLSGREGTEIRFQYAPIGGRPEGVQGPNDGGKYVGTVKELKRSAKGDYTLLMEVADGRGIRAFRVDRMMFVDIMG